MSALEGHYVEEGPPIDRRAFLAFALSMLPIAFFGGFVAILLTGGAS